MPWASVVVVSLPIAVQVIMGGGPPSGKSVTFPSMDAGATRLRRKRTAFEAIARNE